MPVEKSIYVPYSVYGQAHYRSVTFSDEEVTEMYNQMLAQQEQDLVDMDKVTCSECGQADAAEDDYLCSNCRNYIPQEDESESANEFDDLEAMRQEAMWTGYYSAIKGR